jgi:hypothetical protein
LGFDANANKSSRVVESSRDVIGGNGKG